MYIVYIVCIIIYIYIYYTILKSCTYKCVCIIIRDTWRFKGDNHESTNKLNEFWTGKSTFKVLANAEVIDGDKNYKVNQGVPEGM